jgi:hypothetical protein
LLHWGHPDSQVLSRRIQKENYNLRSFPTTYFLLQLAATKGQAELIRYLFENAPECARQGFTKPWSPSLPIPSAFANFNEVQQSKWPITHQGIIANMGGANPVAIFKVFFEYSFDPNPEMEHFGCILSSAINWNADLTEVLVRKGANVNGRSFHHHVLALVAAWRDPEMIDLFVSRGASVRESLALREAAFHRRTCNVEKLLDNGADIDEVFTVARAKVEKLGTALHCAINGAPNVRRNEKARRPEEVVRLLLQRGARLDLVDENGRTPLDLARQRGDDPVIEVFEEMSRA